MRRRIWREKVSSTVKRTRHEINFFQADGGEDPPSVPKGNSENTLPLVTLKAGSSASVSRKPEPAVEERPMAYLSLIHI